MDEPFGANVIGTRCFEVCVYGHVRFAHLKCQKMQAENKNDFAKSIHTFCTALHILFHQK